MSESESQVYLQRAHAGYDVKGQHSRDRDPAERESGARLEKEKHSCDGDEDEDETMWPSMGRGRGALALGSIHLVSPPKEIISALARWFGGSLAVASRLLHNPAPSSRLPTIKRRAATIAESFPVR